jgi:dienelactone hydrolase
MKLLAASLATLAALVTPQASEAAEWVTLPGRSNVTLRAYMVRPAGVGPFPAIVALHGCGGLGSPRQELSARHRDWAERLSGAGYLVIFPESFASRGLGSQCNVRERDVRAKDRAYDAFATAEWLAARSDVQKNRIGLLGWSNGGSTVLSAARDIRRPKGVDFKTAVAFYPGCRTMAKEDYRTRIPVTILHGLADN